MSFGAQRNFTFDTIDDIARVDSLPQIARVFAGAIGQLGFTSFGVVGLPPPAAGVEPPVPIEKVPDGFREFYTEERLYLVDHISAHARVTATAFRSSDAPYERAHARRHVRFMQALRSYGLDKGAIVPTGYPGTPACVWMAGECPDLHDDAMKIIQLIALYAASKVHALMSRRGDDKLPALTAREREVLAWAAQGKSAWETGIILRIAKRTVEQHTRSAMRKLGAANKTHAVVRALLGHMLEI